VSTQTLNTFFALLALVSLGIALAVGVGAVAWALAPSARERLAPLRDDLGRAAVPLAWAIATAAMLGSLYYSEVAHFDPCRFCWFQRIAMYPLAVILGVAALRRDRDIWWYGLPLAVIGLLLASYHYQLQLFPEQGGGGSCDPAVPCTSKWVEEFGFVTIPFMAGAGCLAICALMLLARVPRSVRPDAGDPTEELEFHTEDPTEVPTDDAVGIVVEAGPAESSPR
jgi:disulfide bond formation protein DsbB